MSDYINPIGGGHSPLIGWSDPTIKRDGSMEGPVAPERGRPKTVTVLDCICEVSARLSDLDARLNQVAFHLLGAASEVSTDAIAEVPAAMAEWGMIGVISNRVDGLLFIADRIAKVTSRLEEI